MNIEIGGVYVKAGLEYVMRLITGYGSESGQVRWEAYDVKTGQSTGDSGCCSEDHINRWAGREATEDEIGRMRKIGPTWEEARFQKLTENLLEATKAYNRARDPKEHFEDIARYMQDNHEERVTGTITVDDEVYEFEVKRSLKMEKP